MAETKKIGIVEIIQGAGQAEIDEIDARISILEKELSGLHAARGIIFKRMNGVRARKSRDPEEKIQTDPKESLKLLEAMFETIRLEGPMYAGQLAARLLVRGMEASTQRVGVLAGKSKWFKKDVNGKWSIRRTGDAK